MFIRVRVKGSCLGSKGLVFGGFFAFGVQGFLPMVELPF